MDPGRVKLLRRIWGMSQEGEREQKNFPSSQLNYSTNRANVNLYSHSWRDSCIEWRYHHA